MDMDDDELSSDNELLVENQSPFSFRTLCIISTCTDPSTARRRLCVTIVLSSGVGVGNVSVRMLESGREL